MPDDHSELEPPLPIPNRTVKRLHADDSADTRVKVGNRQAPLKTPLLQRVARGFCFVLAHYLLLLALRFPRAPLILAFPIPA